MSQTGKAFIYKTGEGSDFMWVTDFKTKKSLSKDDVLIKTISAAINPIDYKLVNIPALWFSRKGTPFGMDVCGQVVSVGKNVSDFAPGDVVYGSGQGCAEYTVAKASELAKLPEGEKAPAVYGSLNVAPGTAYQMLELAGMFEGSDPKHVMVIGGSGGVGSCAVQIAKARCAPGSKVTAVCSGKSAEYVKSIGADHIVDYSQTGFVFGSCVPEKSLDAIIDCVSSPDDYNYVPEGMKLIKEKSGRYVAANSGSKMDWIKLMAGSSLGIKFFRGQYQLMFYTANRATLTELGKLVHEGKLKVNVQEYVPFEESAIRKAIETLQGRRVRGKLIVKM